MENVKAPHYNPYTREWKIAYLSIDELRMFVVYIIGIEFCKTVADFDREYGQDLRQTIQEMIEEGEITKQGDILQLNDISTQALLDMNSGVMPEKFKE